MNQDGAQVVKSSYMQTRLLLVTAIAYWIVVMGVWGIFSLERGLNYETNFALNCQNRNLHLCLIYLDDLRPFNSLFLGLSHLLGGDNGSYVSYQLFYGFLWWGRGFFSFLIFRRIFPASPLVGFLIGAIVLSHVSDGAINWIGQIHQLGFMFCLVLAIYLLIESWYSDQKWLAALLLIASLLPLYISLWTYESQFFIVLLIPGILFILNQKINLRLIITSLVWYILPVIYAVLQVRRYLLTREATYQSSIVRPDLALQPIWHDLGLHLQVSLRFWQWRMGANKYTIANLAPLIGVLCAVAFILAGYLVLRPRVLNADLPSKKQLLLCLGIGGIILLLSFPIYLLIAGNTGMWRTQFLSGFGAAIVLASGILLLSRSVVPKPYQALVALGCCAVIVFSGVRGGVIQQGFHGYRWRIHQDLMGQIAQLAPVVKDQTLLLLIDLPKDYEKDPFGASMWFDFPVQLLYPGKRVVGHFFYDDGSQPSDDRWAFTSAGLVREKKDGMPKQFDQANYDQILVFNYAKDGEILLLDAIPSTLLPQGTEATTYAPGRVIEPVLIPDRSTRMFAR